MIKLGDLNTLICMFFHHCGYSFWICMDIFYSLYWALSCSRPHNYGVYLILILIKEYNEMHGGKENARG